MIKKQILILEVNEKNANTLKSIFIDSTITSAISKAEIHDVELMAADFDLVIVNSKIDYINPKELNELINIHFSVKIPVIYIDNSKEFDKKMFRECFNNGVSDYIKKPFDSYEILARVKFHIQQLDKLKEYKLRVDKLASLATQDQMSKSSSRMHMQSILKHYLDSYKREKFEVSIVYLSLLNINKIVSTFGFKYGEKVLSNFSKELKKLIRTSDVLSRWSGSEFMILLPKTSTASAMVFVKKLNSAISKINILNDTKPIVAYGIIEFIEHDSVDEIASRARYALREAQKQEYGKIFSV